MPQPPLIRPGGPHELAEVIDVDGDATRLYSAAGLRVDLPAHAALALDGLHRHPLDLQPPHRRS